MTLYIVLRYAINTNAKKNIVLLFKWLGFVAWLPLTDSTAGETAGGELPLAVCLMGD